MKDTEYPNDAQALSCSEHLKALTEIERQGKALSAVEDELTLLRGIELRAQKMLEARKAGIAKALRSGVKNPRNNDGVTWMLESILGVVSHSTQEERDEAALPQTEPQPADGEPYVSLAGTALQRFKENPLRDDSK